MINLTANPFVRMTIAGLAVWVGSIFIEHGEPNDLKHAFMPRRKSMGADAFEAGVKSNGGKVAGKIVTVME
jgi:hypothetical protein